MQKENLGKTYFHAFKEENLLCQTQNLPFLWESNGLSSKQPLASRKQRMTKSDTALTVLTHHVIVTTLWFEEARTDGSSIKQVKMQQQFYGAAVEFDSLKCDTEVTVDKFLSFMCCFFLGGASCNY